MKYLNCKNIHPMIRPDGKVDFICMKDPENVVDASKDVCQNCVHYKSRKIEYPIMVQTIQFPEMDSEKDDRIGRKVRLMLTEDFVESNNERCYYGTFVGDIISFGHYVKYDEKTQVLKIGQALNPGIFVPELNRLVSGSECFWEFVEEQETII